MRKQKTHKLLTVLSPVIFLIYVIATSLVTGTIEEKLSGIAGFFLHNFVAIALAAFVVLIGIAINKKYSLDVKIDLKLDEKEKHILFLLVCLIPFVFMISHYASYFILTKLMGAEYVTFIYTAEDFKDDMKAAIHAIIIAPILEEFCFRIIPISLCNKRTGKFIMLFFTSLLFGFCHGKNFWMTFIDGVLFGLIFIFTNRPMISVVCHLVYNFFSFLIGVVAFAGFATIYTCSGRPTLVVLEVIPAIFISMVFVMLFIVCYFKKF